MKVIGDILVLGLGRSGEAVVRYAVGLIATGRISSVTAYDTADDEGIRALAQRLEEIGCSVRLGSDRVEGEYGLCVASPGIRPSAPLMSSALEHCGRVISEIEFAFIESPQQWVAITGTNGKTTTTALAVHLLRAGGISARPVGNIGSPAITAVAESDPDEVLVAEVSSFQLALTDRFHPRVAVLLNVTPDHIDWHGSFDQYAADKLRVFANLGDDDLAVVDIDDPGSAEAVNGLVAAGIPVARISRREVHPLGANAADGVLALVTPAGELRLCREDELLIRGAHNVSNALAAAAAAHAFGVSAADLRTGLTGFRAIEHRLESVATIDGIEWFNDSKATNPDAVFKAIDAFAETPLIVLLGGRNKGNDFRPLARMVDKRAKAAVLFGESRHELAAAFEGLTVQTVEAVSLADAVEAARGLATSGDAVVLSPACASFDEFSSYEHRGAVFKSLVGELEGGGAL